MVNTVIPVGCVMITMLIFKTTVFCKLSETNCYETFGEKIGVTSYAIGYIQVHCLPMHSGPKPLPLAYCDHVDLILFGWGR